MSSFSQGQGQFRRTAELDRRKAALKGEGHGGAESIETIARRRALGTSHKQRLQIDPDSAVLAKKATSASAIGYGRGRMAKWAIAEKGHFWMKTISLLLEGT